MQITQVGMTRRHYQSGELSRIRMLVLHATAGRYPGDYHWLRQGGDSRRPVSVHYYIDKQGRISQMVADPDIAWHAGQSRWIVDGRMVNGCNAVSLGIELENRNTGSDPYPPAQYQAALWLARRLVATYDIPRSQLVRHLDISPGRKTDPAGFPWSRFVDDVYAAVVPGTPVPEPRPLSEQLRERLVDQAFRAAGGGKPPDWPLLAAANERRLGMPVAQITGRRFDPVWLIRWRGGSAQDDIDRAVHLAGRPPLVLEAYAGDLLYIEADMIDAGAATAERVRSLSNAPAGSLRDALLGLLFRAADPAAGWRPGWAFHQFYLAHAGELGVPIGPNHRLRLPAGTRHNFACQHFAYDTLCSPVGRWQTIYRLSELQARARNDDGRAGNVRDLSPAMAAELADLLLADLYRSRTRRRYDPAGLLSRYALDQNLGAPLGFPEIETLDGERLLIMPFARDVVYCRVPDDWHIDRQLPSQTAFGQLDGLLGAAGMPFGRLALLAKHHLHPPLLGRRSDLLPSPLPNNGAIRLLGAPAPPPVYDVSHYLPSGRQRENPAISHLLLISVDGPAQRVLAAIDANQEQDWHYLIDRSGNIFHLLPDHFLVTGKAAAGKQGLLIGIEGGPGEADPEAARSLIWLITRLCRHYRIPECNIFVRRTADVANGAEAECSFQVPLQSV
jgi:hypothetical protein